MDIKKIKTLGDLKKSGYKSRTIKEEIRENLIGKIQSKENTFPGIIGYDETVIPDTERALLSRHNIHFLGLRGQSKTRMARQMVDLLDEYIPTVAGSEITNGSVSEYGGENSIAQVINYGKSEFGNNFRLVVKEDKTANTQALDFMLETLKILNIKNYSLQDPSDEEMAFLSDLN